MPGKARVLASSAEIKLVAFGVTVLIGEIDNFTATSTSVMGKSRPIGTAIEAPYVKYGGWELSFKGGKVNWDLANQIHVQDILTRTASINPVFDIYQTITYYDGSTETYIYNDTVIFGYSLNMQSGSETTEDFKAFSPQRQKVDLGIIESILGQISAKIAAEAIEKFKAEVGNNLGLF